MSSFRISIRWQAILLALLVTFLWSTSWVLIKFGLDEIPPLTFAGLRYTLAFLVLVPGVWKQKDKFSGLSKIDLRNLVILGIVFYALTQGGAFVALNHMDAITFSLLLSTTPLLVALFGMFALREIPSGWQWLGVAVFLGGVLVYFYPLLRLGYEKIGLLVGGLTVCANAAASVLGRYVNREKSIPPLVVTVISMGVGAFILLGAGLILEDVNPISLANWAIILWLAVINTALAFTLWNLTLQRLSAVESSVINNTMLIQITILAVIFLGESLSGRDVLGLSLVMVGIIIVQLANPPVES
jgi:drug/metabolite transporter (DMT)-like permease